MNNSINYSGYVDMLLDSSDEFEPYGYSAPSNLATEALGISETNLRLHRESLNNEPWGE